MNNLALYLLLFVTLLAYDAFVILFALQRLLLPKLHAAVSFLISVLLVIALALWSASHYETPLSQQHANLLRVGLTIGSLLATAFIFWRIARSALNWKQLLLGIAILAVLTAANVCILQPHMS